MNKTIQNYIKILSLGSLIWLIPFTIVFSLWDLATSSPIISLDWYNAIKGFSELLVLLFLIFRYFKNTKYTTKESVKVGIIWYIEVLLIDFLVNIILFNNAIPTFYPMFLKGLNIVLLSVGIGYIKHKI